MKIQEFEKLIEVLKESDLVNMLFQMVNDDDENTELLLKKLN